MVAKGLKRSGEYYDSVTLMLVARELTREEGVLDAAVVMGTAENKEILRAGGLLMDLFLAASDTDLLIAVKATQEETATRVLELADSLLRESKNKKAERGRHLPKSLEGAVRQLPDANLVIISVAGRYAAGVAKEALDKGLHVMLFSDNVPVEKEKELKELAQSKGLFVMGPDCGTAIINGAPLCFANVVPRGDIGMVAASGTGLQEVSSIIANRGGGISQAIGTGGRDVKREIGGIMFLQGMRALAADQGTRVIVLVSKPPAPEVQERIAKLIPQLGKPVVAILIGGDPQVLEKAGAHVAEDLEQAALLAVALARGEEPDGFKVELANRREGIRATAQAESARMKAGQRYVRGLFSGGTLCDETQLLFREEIGDVFSPSPINPAFRLGDIWKSKENTVVDLGEDEFTVGRPHPMIDFALRQRRIVEEARDPETAVILLDVVLGYGSNREPGEELVPAIQSAKEVAAKEGRHLVVVCSITGTSLDPQDPEKVRAQLEGAGAMVMPTNAAASQLAAEIVKLQGGK